MKKAVKILIMGTVQGVFFRNFIKESADKVNIKGFARNLENGSVEVIAEGNQEDVQKFIELCKQGPKFASIKDVKVEENRFSGEFKEFKILRM
jgi:acylphosphatase